MDIAYFDSTAATLNENLAIDEALLLAAEAGASDEVLRFWEWPTPAIVLGAGGSIAIDVNEASCSADSVPIHRRASGGGTVVLARGCLLISLVLRYERASELRDVNASYRWILGALCDALRPVANVQHVGISDLAVNGCKVSGNAQQRKARHLLHHGTLLYDFDLPLVARYLKLPERQPPYREGREHGAFVTNLPMDASRLKASVIEVLDAKPGTLKDEAIGNIPQLIDEKYGRDDWVRRR